MGLIKNMAKQCGIREIIQSIPLRRQTSAISGKEQVDITFRYGKAGDFQLEKVADVIEAFGSRITLSATGAPSFVLKTDRSAKVLKEIKRFMEVLQS